MGKRALITQVTDQKDRYGHATLSPSKTFVLFHRFGFLRLDTSSSIYAVDAGAGAAWNPKR